MRAYVFTDERLRRHAGRFVWLALNTEKKTSAAFLKRNPVPALPSFLVVEPDSGKVLMRWVGGATVAQLERIFDDATVAYQGSASSGPEAVLARADRLYGDNHYVEAVAAYREALAGAPPDWPSYARTIEALLYALTQADSSEAVVELAHESYPRLIGTPSAASAAGSGLDAALGLPDEHPKKREWISDFEMQLQRALADTAVALAADDRSGYLSLLLDARKAADDTLGARLAAEAWARHLEQAAAGAKTPEQRMVFDPHRLSAYLELEHPERAIPMLEQSQRDFPDDYNPPARLAIAYQNLKRWDEALAANGRAMSKAYGPRKIRIYITRSEILTGKGDVAAAKATLEEAIAYAQALPDGQRSESSIASLKKRLEKLGSS